jgi:hypothetical protein
MTHWWDEHLALFLRHCGFLELSQVVNSRLPDLDLALLTIAVDRWRLETHNFHLPCDEMTITLQDIALIFGLPLHALPVSGLVDPKG